MAKTLADWLAEQPKGALTRLMHSTKLAWATVSRAKRGIKVDLKTAVLISRATAGEVAVSSMTHDDVLNEDDSSSRVA